MFPVRTVDPASRTSVYAAGHLQPFYPRPWMVGSTPVLTLSASVAAQRWRDIQLWETDLGTLRTCPSGRPIGRMTGALPRRPSQGLGRGSKINFGKWEGCPPPALLARASGLAGKGRRLPSSATPSGGAHMCCRTHSLEGPASVGRPVPLGPALWTARTSSLRWATVGLTQPAPCLGGSCPYCYLFRRASLRVGGSAQLRIYRDLSEVSRPGAAAHRACTHSMCGAPHYGTFSDVLFTCALAHRVWSWLGPPGCGAPTWGPSGSR